MYRLSLFTSLALVSLSFSTARAQQGVHSTQELHEIEQQSYKAALQWSAKNNFPAQITLDDNSAIAVMRIDNQHPVFFTTHNKMAGSQTSTNALHDGLNLGIKLTGDGLRIGIWDEGAVLENHQELDFRVNLRDQGGASNHATHVAGTLIASGVLEDATGMAPNANIDSFNWNFHTSEMQSEAGNGLLISNHSYGRIAGWHQLSIAPSQSEWYWFGDPSVSETEDYSFGYYDRDASLFDHVTYGNPDYLPVVSAGNERDDAGPYTGTYKALDMDGRWIDHDATNRTVEADGGVKGFDTITSLGVAKNVLTVGSVGTGENLDTPALSPFSSAGPTDDGRIKPDIVGIGENLLSSIGSGTAEYARYSGTSMATPNVAGSLLLLQQMASQVRNQPVRSATLKGLVIHTATDLGRPGPDYNFGWGLLNTSKAAALIMAGFRKPGVIQESELEPGTTIVQELILPESGPLKITLSWTDPPGTPDKTVGPEKLNNRSPSLINDLDMALTYQDTEETYLPYVLSPIIPEEPAQTGDNKVDPLEHIFVEHASEGIYTLQISHKGELIQGKNQPYSLIVTGIETTLSPVSLDSAYADAEIGSVVLTWGTRFESTPGYFVIERADLAPAIASNVLGVNYQPLAQITSRGSMSSGQTYQFEDQVYLRGVYQYRIIYTDEENNNRILMSELNVDIPAPSEFSIPSVFPNPATTGVQIVVDLPLDMEVVYTAFNLLGQPVYKSEGIFLSAGRHFIALDTSLWSPGIYFIQIQSSRQRIIRKVVIMG